MTITPTTSRAICDVHGCKQSGAYTFKVKGAYGNFVICKDCATQLAMQINKLTTPKSPKNAICKTLNKTTIVEQDKGEE